MRDPEWHHGDIEELPYTEAPAEPEDSLEWLHRYRPPLPLQREVLAKVTPMTSDVQEVNVNMVVGAVINTTITYYLFDITPQFALVSTGIFFVASWVRSYGLRRLFRYLEER